VLAWSGVVTAMLARCALPDLSVVERFHFQRLVNKVGTTILTLNEPFSMACKQRGRTSPRLVSEHRARRNPTNSTSSLGRESAFHAIAMSNLTPTDSREEPERRLGGPLGVIDFRNWAPRS
jgi:hypothetical protein